MRLRQQRYDAGRPISVSNRHTPEEVITGQGHTITAHHRLWEQNGLAVGVEVYALSVDRTDGTKCIMLVGVVGHGDSEEYQVARLRTLTLKPVLCMMRRTGVYSSIIRNNLDRVRTSVERIQDHVRTSCP